MDPITIGLAFTAAQHSVNYIKKAIQLGKDVNSLYGQFAKFFENSDTIHSANIKAQNSKNILTDGQIRALSIQIAMQSKALRDAEKELKELTNRALQEDIILKGKNINIESYDALMRVSGGDGRKLLNLLELITFSYPPDAPIIINDNLVISK
jgi:hypothetical protein